MNKLFIFSAGLMLALATMTTSFLALGLALKELFWYDYRLRKNAACHGVDGSAPSDQFPRIGGQYESYIKQALHEYKNGDRKNPIMAPQAAQLSDQDIDNVAAWFSQQNGKLHVLNYSSK